MKLEKELIYTMKGFPSHSTSFSSKIDKLDRETENAQIKPNNMQKAIFEGVSFSLPLAKNKLFVGVEAGYGKSLILGQLAHLRLS